MFNASFAMSFPLIGTVSDWVKCNATSVCPIVPVLSAEMVWFLVIMTSCYAVGYDISYLLRTTNCIFPLKSIKLLRGRQDILHATATYKIQSLPLDMLKVLDRLKYTTNRFV